MAKAKNLQETTEEAKQVKPKINYEDITNRRIELAKERGAYVSVPQSPEASTLALMINSIDFVFRESKNPRIRMSVKDIKTSAEATIKFKEALIVFSLLMKKGKKEFQ